MAVSGGLLFGRSGVCYSKEGTTTLLNSLVYFNLEFRGLGSGSLEIRGFGFQACSLAVSGSGPNFFSCLGVQGLFHVPFISPPHSLFYGSFHNQGDPDIGPDIL